MLKESLARTAFLELRDIRDSIDFRRGIHDAEVEHPFKGCQFTVDRCICDLGFLSFLHVRLDPCAVDVHDPEALER